MNLTITNNQFTLQFPFSAETINKVKGCGLKLAPRIKSWVAPANCVTAMNLARVFPELGDQLNGYLPEEVNNWIPSPYLMAHQAEAGRIGLKEPRFGFFWSCGTGKTLTGIELVKQKRIKTLVVCPLSIITNAWMRDIEHFAPELKAVNLWALKGKKIPEHDIGIVNFEQFRTTYEKLSGYKMVFIDESSKCKSAKSLVTKALIEYCDNVPFVYLFSGTPAPNNNLEFFPQMRIIDPTLLGRSYYQFRNSYCYSTGFGGYQWKMREDKLEDFLGKIGSKSQVIEKEDVLDLPERVFINRVISLTEKEKAAYREMERNMLLELGDQESVAANAAVKIMKLREATSGFFLDTEGEIIHTGDSKLNALVELLEEIGNHQVLCWYQFRHEGNQIEKALGDQCGRVDGSISSQKEKDQTVQDFINGKIKYLIAHPASLGHGVNLQHCNYAVYYSMDYSYERYFQSRDRIYRKGQVNKCTYFTLLADKTIDGVILKALENKEDTANAVFRFIKNEAHSCV